MNSYRKQAEIYLAALLYHFSGPPLGFDHRVLEEIEDRSNALGLGLAREHGLDEDDLKRVCSVDHVVEVVKKMS